MQQAAISVIGERRSVVGESPIWDDARQQITYVDIVGKRIVHASLDSANADVERATDDWVTSIGLCEDGQYIVGLANIVALWDGAHRFTPITKVGAEMPGVRLNEGAVGPDGAYWVGTMQNNITEDGQPLDITRHIGRLYRISACGTVVEVSMDQFGITNTMIWPDTQTLITADTLENALFQYPIRPDGALGERSIFLKDAAPGLPDGSCIDEEGYIYNARAGAGCLARLSPSGDVVNLIDLPVASPTSCCFGGPNLDILFVTSARFGMDNPGPLDGAVIALSGIGRGKPAYRFKK